MDEQPEYEQGVNCLLRQEAWHENEPNYKQFRICFAFLELFYA